MSSSEFSRKLPKAPRKSKAKNSAEGTSRKQQQQATNVAGKPSHYKTVRHISHNPFNTFKRQVKPIIDNFIYSLAGEQDKGLKARLFKHCYWKFSDDFKKIEGADTPERVYSEWFKKHEALILRECQVGMNAKPGDDVRNSVQVPSAAAIQQPNAESENQKNLNLVWLVAHGHQSSSYLFQ
ncbi:hypothetical protein HDE_01191 [Halotydeus destructor]|nr:hypothetical protein HDE_01191 [Halotydeus destructor]